MFFLYVISVPKTILPKIWEMEFVIHLHCIIRYVILILIAWSLINAMVKRNRNTFDTRDLNIYKWTKIVIELQIVIGFILYFYFEHYKGFSQMDIPIMRFRAVEHPFGMLLAVGFSSIGYAKMKRAVEASVKHKKIMIFYALALLLIVVSIPYAFRFG